MARRGHKAAGLTCRQGGPFVMLSYDGRSTFLSHTRHIHFIEGAGNPRGM